MKTAILAMVLTAIGCGGDGAQSFGTDAIAGAGGSGTGGSVASTGGAQGTGGAATGGSVGGMGGAGGIPNGQGGATAAPDCRLDLNWNPQGPYVCGKAKGGIQCAVCGLPNRPPGVTGDCLQTYPSLTVLCTVDCSECI